MSTQILWSVWDIKYIWKYCWTSIYVHILYKCNTSIRFFLASSIWCQQRWKVAAIWDGQVNTSNTKFDFHLHNNNNYKLHMATYFSFRLLPVKENFLTRQIFKNSSVLTKDDIERVFCLYDRVRLPASDEIQDKTFFRIVVVR